MGNLPSHARRQSFEPRINPPPKKKLASRRFNPLQKRNEPEKHAIANLKPALPLRFSLAAKMVLHRCSHSPRSSFLQTPMGCIAYCLMQVTVLVRFAFCPV